MSSQLHYYNRNQELVRYNPIHVPPPNSYNNQQYIPNQNPNCYNQPQGTGQDIISSYKYIKETTGIIKPKPERTKAKDFFGNYDCTNYENGEIIEDTKLKKELNDVKEMNIELVKELKELKESSNYSRGRSRERSRHYSRSRSRDHYSRRSSRYNSRSRSRDRYSRRSSRYNSRSRSRDRYSRRSSRDRYSRRISHKHSDNKKRHNISIGQYKITPCKYGNNCKHRYEYMHRIGDDCTYLHEGDRDDKNNLVPVSREMAERLYLKYKNN